MRIHWHQFLGKDFDLVFTPLGLEILLERLALSEPPRIDIVILRRHTPEWTAEQFALLPDGIRQSKASHILIEHKQTESINLQVFKQALIYDELYPQGHGVKPSAVQTFILSARTPSSKTLQECGFVAGELAGVYTSNNLYAARLTLISLNELQPTLNNAFVQCFATRRRVRDAAFKLLLAQGWERMSNAFWDFLLGLQQQWAEKEGEMTTKLEERVLTPEMMMETGKAIRKLWLANLTPEELATLPPEKRLAGLAPEDRLAGLAPEDRLAGLAPEDRLAGLAPEDRLAGLAPEELEQLVEKVPLEQRLAGLAPEDMPKLMKQIEAFLSQQQVSGK